MKLNITKHLLLWMIGVFSLMHTMAQDASINILAGNGGLVATGQSFLLRVDVTNNDAAGTIVQNKLRPQISVPAGISAISTVAADHQLPAGWTITSNSGTVIRITNTTDPIPAGVTRTAFISIRGTVIGTGSIIANLTFVGAAPTGDIGANNSSSTGIEVTNPSPVELGNFSAALENCRPVLKWATEAELNSHQFEIERANANGTGWTTIGTVAASGNSTTKTQYSFTDAGLNGSNKKVLYRLRIVDKDGRFEYSPTLPVSLNCNVVGVTVFPNPVKDGRLYVGLTGTSGRTQGILRNLAGQVLSQVVLANGTNLIQVAQLPAGLYVLEVTDGGHVSQKTKVLIANER
jgi:hypothetical protein